jgi:excisionase family DNA binding protein
MLGVTPNTVSRWAREGRLPSVQTLGGHRRFEAHLIEELVRREGGRLNSPPPSGLDEES